LAGGDAHGWLYGHLDAMRTYLFIETKFGSSLNLYIIYKHTKYLVRVDSFAEERLTDVSK